MPLKQSLGNLGIMSSNTGHNACLNPRVLKTTNGHLSSAQGTSRATHSDIWGSQQMYQTMFRIHVVLKIEPRLVRYKVAPVLLSCYHHS